MEDKKRYRVTYKTGKDGNIDAIGYIEGNNLRNTIYKAKCLTRNTSYGNYLITYQAVDIPTGTIMGVGRKDPGKYRFNDRIKTIKL